MARWFRTEKDTSLPRAFRAVRDNSGTVYDYETEGVPYDKGDYVNEADVDPRVVKRFDDGDEHLNSLLTEVDEQEVADAQVDSRLVRTPEHSVEAYVLSSDVEQPYKLLSEEEALEKNAEGAEDAAKAQAEAKKEANDKVSAEADERSAIDAAAAKGEVDREAGRSLSVSETVEAEADSSDSPATKSESKSDSATAASKKKSSSENEG